MQHKIECDQRREIMIQRHKILTDWQQEKKRREGQMIDCGARLQRCLSEYNVREYNNLYQNCEWSMPEICQLQPVWQQEHQQWRSQHQVWMAEAKIWEPACEKSNKAFVQWGQRCKPIGQQALTLDDCQPQSKALDHQMERCKALADEWERLKAGFEQEKQAINEDRRETNEALEELGERYREQINALAQEDAFDWDDEDWGDDEEEIWGTHWAELESPNSEVCSADTCSDTHPEEDETLSVSELMHWLDSGEKVGELLSDALLAIGIIPTPQTRLASTVIQGLSKTALISLSAGLKARARQLIANGGWVGNNVSKEIIKSAGSSRGFKSVTSDLNGGIESANRIFRVLTSSKPVEGIITRIPNKNIELYLRSKSKTGTPVLEIKNYKLRTYEKIHFNP